MKKCVHQAGDKTIVFYQKDINASIATEAGRVASKAFFEGIRENLPLDVQVTQMLTNRGLIDEKGQIEKAELLEAKIKEHEKGLRKGVFGQQTLDKHSGWQIALNIRKFRRELSKVNEDTLGYYNNTAESYSRMRKFQYCVYAITCDEQGAPIWKSFDDYLADDSSLPTASMSELLKVKESTNYEDKWLKKFNCLRDGKLFNLSGQEVDDDGNVLAPPAEPEVPDVDAWDVEETTPESTETV